MRIKEAAEKAGVGVETLRYYERRGLLDAPPRTGAGYRSYDAEAVRVVRFIKGAQELGFTLKEVAELLALREGGTCSEARAAAELKLEDVGRKIERLRAIRAALEELVSTCTGTGSTRSCPILEAMEGQE
ncbi:MAG: MerR family transcriptional regulator [Sandaracinaceae bacterium]|nr:heavy metal-responsive transcriptional regulator [Myxococcales bacterium]